MTPTELARVIREAIESTMRCDPGVPFTVDMAIAAANNAAQAIVLDDEGHDHGPGDREAVAIGLVLNAAERAMVLRRQANLARVNRDCMAMMAQPSAYAAAHQATSELSTASDRAWYIERAYEGVIDELDGLVGRLQAAREAT